MSGHGGGGHDVYRHVVAFCGTLICLLAYVSGYYSGENGWWWTAFGMLIMYGGIFSILGK